MHVAVDVLVIMLRIKRESKALKLHTDSMQKIGKAQTLRKRVGTYDLSGFCTAVAILI